MIAIHQLTRFLAGLGEIVNILTAPVVAALAYLAAMERFMGERLMGDHMMTTHAANNAAGHAANNAANHADMISQDMAIFMSIIIATVTVGFVNGGFAVLFSIRRLLAEGRGQGSTPKAKPTPAMKTAEMKTAEMKATPEDTSKDTPKDEQTSAPTPKPKAKVKKAGKKATKTKT